MIRLLFVATFFSSLILSNPSISLARTGNSTFPNCNIRLGHTFLKNQDMSSDEMGERMLALKADLSRKTLAILQKKGFNLMSESFAPPLNSDLFSPTFVISTFTSCKSLRTLFSYKTGKCLCAETDAKIYFASRGRVFPLGFYTSEVTADGHRNLLGHTSRKIQGEAYLKSLEDLPNCESLNDIISHSLDYKDIYPGSLHVKKVGENKGRQEPF